MAFPIVQSVTATTFTSDTTAHAVNMPATVNAGDLLLCLFANDGSATITTPSGWTSKGETNPGGAVRHKFMYKIADGTEDGTTVDFVTSSAETAVAQVYRITGWYGDGTGIERNSATGNSNTPNPPALDPSTWDIEETLWIAIAGTSASVTSVSSYPSSYTGGTYNQSGSGTNHVQLASAYRNNAVSSENPATFTFDASADWIGTTIAIRPQFLFQTIEPSLLENTPTFYNAAFVVGGLLIAPLLDNTPTFYNASFVYEQTLIPELLTNTPTFYDVAMAQTITAPLLDNTPTFYGPEIINTQVLVAPLLTNTPTFYGPEFRGPRNIGAPLLTNTQTFYGPTVFSLWSDTNDLTSGTWSDVDIPQ